MTDLRGVIMLILMLTPPAAGYEDGLCGRRKHPGTA